MTKTIIPKSIQDSSYQMEYCSNQLLIAGTTTIGLSGIIPVMLATLDVYQMKVPLEVKLVRPLGPHFMYHFGTVSSEMGGIFSWVNTQNLIQLGVTTLLFSSLTAACVTKNLDIWQDYLKNTATTSRECSYIECYNPSIDVVFPICKRFHYSDEGTAAIWFLSAAVNIADYFLSGIVQYGFMVYANMYELNLAVYYANNPIPPTSYTNLCRFGAATQTQTCVVPNHIGQGLIAIIIGLAIDELANELSAAFVGCTAQCMCD